MAAQGLPRRGRIVIFQTGPHPLSAFENVDAHPGLDLGNPDDETALALFIGIADEMQMKN